MNETPLTRVEQAVEDINRLIARQFERGDDDRGRRLRAVLVGAIATSAVMLASTSSLLLAWWAL